MKYKRMAVIVLDSVGIGELLMQRVLEIPELIPWGILRSGCLR